MVHGLFTSVVQEVQKLVSSLLIESVAVVVCSASGRAITPKVFLGESHLRFGLVLHCSHLRLFRYCLQRVRQCDVILRCAISHTTAPHSYMSSSNGVWPWQTSLFVCSFVCLIVIAWIHLNRPPWDGSPPEIQGQLFTCQRWYYRHSRSLWTGRLLQQALPCI